MFLVEMGEAWSQHPVFKTTIENKQYFSTSNVYCFWVDLKNNMRDRNISRNLDYFEKWKDSPADNKYIETDIKK